MKQWIKSILVIVVCLLVFPICTTTYAVEKNEDGITVELKTDKTDYEDNEEVVIDLYVTNTNDSSIALTHIENQIPDGFVLVEGELNKLENKTLDPNETIHLKTVLKTDDSKSIASIIDNAENESDNPIKETADDYQIHIWIVLISAGTAVVYIFTKQKKNKKIISVLLIVGVCGSFAIEKVNAESLSNTITISQTINYNKTIVTINSNISYEKSQEPKQPVVFQDDVIECDVPFDNNDEEKIVTVFSKDSNFEIGKIYVLKGINEENGLVIKVEKTAVVDNSIVVHYSVPEIYEVIKSIDYDGVETEKGIIIPAEGVTFSDESLNTPVLACYRFNHADSLQLNKKKKFHYELDDVTLDGDFSLDRINYDFNISCSWFQCDVKKAFATLETSFNAKVNGDKEFIGDKRIKLAKFVSPIGNGFVAEGNLYAFFDSHGSVSLDYTLDVEGGFNYEKGKFKGIWEIDNKLKKANVNANIALGFIVEPKVSFLNIGLASAEYELGRNYEMNMDTLSFIPLKYCLDAGYYNFSSISAILLPGSWNKKFTTSITDKDNTTIKDILHLEENGIVDDCTRKYGSLEGIVMKHDSTEDIPLLYAKVTLNKDGKEMYSGESSTGGRFNFSKVAKGKYDIIVRSNYYETYKGTVEIIGGKKIALEKPIILKPYAKSVIVKGRIFDNKNRVVVPNATVSVEGYPDRSAVSDYYGCYTLEVPVGNQKITVTAKNYTTNTYSDNFTKGLDALDIGLDREYAYKVLTINAGESYSLDFTGSKHIFAEVASGTETSSYKNGNADYRGYYDDGGEAWWTPVEDGHHWEIKVYSGSMTLYVSDDFDMGPTADITDYATYTNMNGIDPFIAYTIEAGQTLTFDNQQDTMGSAYYNVISKDVDCEEVIVSYYMATHFGWDVDTSTNQLKGEQNFWSSIGGLSKKTFTVKSGSLTVYYYRLENLTVY